MRISSWLKRSFGLRNLVKPSLLLLLLLSGCGGEIRRQLTDQNRQAGEFIQEHATAPEVKQAGKDVELNSQEVLLWTGPPREVIEYTPDNSKEIRVESKKQRESSIWFKLKQFFGGKVMEAIISMLASVFPGWSLLPGLLGFAWGAWKFYREKKEKLKVRALLEGGNGVLKAIKADDALTVEGAKKILQEAQSLYNVGKDVKEDLEALWEKNKLKKVE